MRTAAPSPRRQRGMSLIELLVAFVIFAFGMLGVAGLQVKTVTYSQSSLLRSQATALADDIIDRMRVDRNNAIAGRWNTTIAAASGDITPLTYIYQTDLKDWKTQVENLLPGGQASIAVASDKTVTIVIQWTDRRDTPKNSGGSDAEDTTQSWTTVTRL